MFCVIVYFIILGITLKRYDYSERQSGKSYCDTKIAYMRSKLRIFFSDGHSICSAFQIKAAIDSGTGIRGLALLLIMLMPPNNKLRNIHGKE